MLAIVSETPQVIVKVKGIESQPKSQDLTLTSYVTDTANTPTADTFNLDADKLTVNYLDPQNKITALNTKIWYAENQCNNIALPAAG